MALKADIKAALAGNFNARQRNRILAGFLDAYNYTDDDGQPYTLSEDAAEVGDAVADTIVQFIRQTVRASEKNALRRALTEPEDLQER